MSILVFAFRGTIAHTTAKLLQCADAVVIIDSSVAAIERFVRTTSFDRYEYILGLGVYSRRDKEMLKIETVCSGRFGRNASDSATLALPSFLTEAPGMKLATSMGIGWCNLVSYRLMQAVHPQHYSFVHIPKTFSAQRAAALLDEQLAAACRSSTVTS